MTKKRHFTDVRFGHYDGRGDTIRLMIGGWANGNVTFEGEDLDMVTAAFFHLFGHTVEPGLKHFKLRKYKNGSVTAITDDRMSVHHPLRRRKHALAWSLMESDNHPGELRLFVKATQASMWMDFAMDKATTTEFGRRLADAAGWDVS